jgi:thymidylate synthase (FAD)
MQSDLKGLAAYVSAQSSLAPDDSATVHLPDGGSVELQGFFGDSLDICNVARESTERHKEVYGPEDGRLIEYLWENEHTSPFRHQFIRFHIRCPIFVARQWMKHVVGCAWNERSARYVRFSTDKHGFWRPTVWREGDQKIKQGSLGPLPDVDQGDATRIYDDAVEHSFRAYEALIELGVCREQARAVLPVSMHTGLVWTASLQALAHFLNLRLDSHAQEEIRVYAQACHDLALRAGGGVFREALKRMVSV